MLFYIYTNETNLIRKGELVNMLNDEIREARKKLDESIVTGKDYQEIYKLSVELDELIAKYYKINKESNNFD